MFKMPYLVLGTSIGSIFGFLTNTIYWNSHVANAGTTFFLKALKELAQSYNCELQSTLSRLEKIAEPIDIVDTLKMVDKNSPLQIYSYIIKDHFSKIAIYACPNQQMNTALYSEARKQTIDHLVENTIPASLIIGGLTVAGLIISYYILNSQQLNQNSVSHSHGGQRCSKSH